MTMRTNDNGVQRDMTEAEQAAHLAWAELVEKEQAAIQQAETAKQAAAASARAKLAALGLTENEINALVGA